MTEEPHIPFEYEVLYEDERIIVIDKPHFLATTPRGMWYRETALIRLRERCGEPDIVPAHRLDRPTAGVVVFVRDPAVRGAYQMLFQNHMTVKTYECMAPLAPPQRPRYGTVERSTGIGRSHGTQVAHQQGPRTITGVRKRRHAERGDADRTWRRCVAIDGKPFVNYTLHPRTGKTHQLRVHMNSLGLPILGDDFYPDIVQRAYDDFSQPLELVARELRFDDPLNGEPRRFVSHVPLGAGL